MNGFRCFTVVDVSYNVTAVIRVCHHFLKNVVYVGFIMLNLSVIHNLKVSGRQNIFVYSDVQTAFLAHS